MFNSLFTIFGSLRTQTYFRFLLFSTRKVTMLLLATTGKTSACVDRLSLRCGRRLFRAKGEISTTCAHEQKRRGSIFFPSRVMLARPVGYEPTSFSHDVMTATSVYHNNETVCHASVIFLITRWDVENNGFLAGVPLLPPPRAWSRALIPFPFPFERLPRKLVKTLFCSNKLYSCRPRE